MDWQRGGKRGCAALLVVLLIMAGIYFYAFRETEQTTPGPTLPLQPVE